MWKLSPDAEQEANDLYHRMRRSSFLSGSRETAKLIHQLAERGEPAAIPPIASGLFSSSKLIHNASSDGVSALLKTVPSDELIRFGEALGGYNWGYVSERWHGLTPKEVDLFLRSTNDIPVGNLLSFHKNGYVRHAAIRFLSNISTGEELRFLLVRLNDWVDAIFEDARKAVLKKLTSEYLCHFSNESFLVFRLLQFKRRDLSHVVSRYVDLLVMPGHKTELKSVMQGASKKAGRSLVRRLLERDGDHLVDTVRLGLTSNDPVIRTNCLKRVADCLPVNECVRQA